MSKISEITIITPQTMIYISKIFQKKFQEKNIKCNIIVSKNFKLHEYNKILLQSPYHYYFIYCLFLINDIENLPFRRYIIYQLEQHTNNKFSSHYNKILPKLQQIYHNAFKVFEYNTQNIHVTEQYFHFKPNLLKIPFSFENNCIQKYQHEPKEYDIVFVGSLNLRRRNILNYLQKYFTIGIPKRNIYGKDLVDFVCKGKILLNIHYYDNAILERPRLNEMIPIGIPIVSEKPNIKDLSILSLYEKNVHFIPIINEINIRKTLPSEIQSYVKNPNIHGMKQIEKDFIENFNLSF